MNTPISGIIPKLLAKKGYDESCKYCVDDEFDKPMPYNGGMGMHQNSFGMYYSCPTIAQVIMWLYEKHGIWIESVMMFPKKWEYNIYRIESTNLLGEPHSQLSSPTEAYLQAIEYTLKNLINDTN